MGVPYRLDLTFEIAREKFAASNPELLVKNAGAELQDKKIFLPYFNEKVTITWPEAEFIPEISIQEKILVLHYLTKSIDLPPLGTWVGFAELKDGLLYLEPFRKRTVNLLVRTFGRAPNLLAEKAKKLGAKFYHKGDISFQLKIFPKIDLFFVFWSEDEEFPANANILFDARARLYLEIEDLVQLASLAVLKLIK
ncbi:hypothetical protein ciss_18190 [Carboxydothermus islandicus]|uniref:DUF3786 domain-containing protein n=1 Tax=Carboxydothermus islandicus TaxID=661089 RepID=A0A1L8D3V7_9THEO|nr:DUF3786 domain-containing protein [Carboxydothermus islandicus]GAV25886.1 hypothetical protein ciss_18190 [Carboxydothermus islandicus]